VRRVAQNDRENGIEATIVCNHKSSVSLNVQVFLAILFLDLDTALNKVFVDVEMQTKLL